MTAGAAKHTFGGGQSVWLINRTALPALLSLTLSGNTLVTWLSNLRDGPPMQLLGLPVIMTDILPVLGVQGDLALVDRQEFPWLAETDESDQWEDLLVAETADAILIGRGTATDDLRARQLQELARLGRPMLVTFPGHRVRVLEQRIASYEIRGLVSHRAS